MKPTRNLKIVFIASIIALLALPFYFIYKSESLMAEEENIYKFRPMQLIDPYDPLRGNYMIVAFDRGVVWNGLRRPNNGQEVYVLVERDSTGYAFFKQAVGEKPETSNYFTTRCSQGRNTSSSEIFIEIPFEKYFINEGNAKLAEMVYLRERGNPNSSMYIEVAIADGESLLKGIYFEGKPFNEYLNDLSPDERSEIESEFENGNNRRGRLWR